MSDTISGSGASEPLKLDVPASEKPEVVGSTNDNPGAAAPTEAAQFEAPELADPSIAGKRIAGERIDTHVRIFNQMLRLAAGNPEQTARIIQAAEEIGLVLGEDERSPELQQWDRDHAGFGPAKSPGDFDFTNTASFLPPNATAEDHADLTGALAQAGYLMGLPGRLGSSVLTDALREGLRVTALPEAEQVAAAQKVTKHLAAFGDPQALMKTAFEALDFVKAQEPEVYALLHDFNVFVDTGFIVHVAKAWTTAKERRALAAKGWK